MHDPAGNVTSIAYPNGKTVTRAYDGAGQLTSVTDWLGHTTTFAHDGDGNVATEQLPGSVTQRSSYDAADRLTRMSDSNAAGPLASFSYVRDALGQLSDSTETGAVSGTFAYGYDRANRLSSCNSASFAYDAGDNATSYAAGQTQTFDAASELVSSSVATQTACGSTGAPVSTPTATGGGSGAPGGGGAATQAVPPAVSGTGGTASTASSHAPGSVTVTFMGSTTKLLPGQRLRTAVTAKQAGDLLLAFVSAAGPQGSKQRTTAPVSVSLTWHRVGQAATPGGVVTAWQATARHSVKRVPVVVRLVKPSPQAFLTVVAFAPGAHLGSHVSRSGSRGRPQAMISTAVGALIWTAGHDAARGGRPHPMAGSQLVTQLHSGAKHSASWLQRFAPSHGGTLSVGDSRPTSTRWALVAVAVLPGGVVSAAHVLVGTAAPRSFAYNAEGDRTGVSSGPSTISLGYDQANRLVSVTGGITYSYDGDGLHMSKTVGGVTSQFAWDRSSTLPLLLQDGATYYVYGPNGDPIEQITGSAATYLLADHQGSTRLLTDDRGHVVGSYSYDPWGNVTSKTGSATTDLQYDGEYTDAETGYQYLRARYYDPSTGQFVSSDPAYVVTRARYDYAADSPQVYDDPSGLSIGDPIGFVQSAWDTIQATGSTLATPIVCVGGAVKRLVGAGKARCGAAARQAGHDVKQAGVDWAETILHFPPTIILPGGLNLPGSQPGPLAYAFMPGQYYTLSSYIPDTYGPICGYLQPV